MSRTAALLTLLIAACRPAAEGTADIRLAGAWARATAPAQRTSAAYLTIANRGRADDALVNVRSSAGTVAIHSSSTDGGIMRMRKLDRLAIPAGVTVRLEPMANHLMVSGIRTALAAGDSIDLTLRFERSGDRTISARVIDAGQAK